MENNIAFPIALEFTKGGSPKITDRNGFSIANLSNTVHKHRTPQGEFIVTACNNYQALKEENTLLKEVNEAQIFTIEKYQKENDELKRLLVQILKLGIQEDYYKMHIVEPITDLLTKHTK
jgi:hypothetical protein